MNTRELKGRRVASGYIQADVAKMLGITQKTLSYYENAPTCKFTAEQIKILAYAFRLSVADVNNIFFDGYLPNGNTVANGTLKNER